MSDNDQKEEVAITILSEPAEAHPIPVEEEQPLVPERPSSPSLSDKTRAAVGRTTRKAAQQIKRGSGKVVAKGTQVMRDKVATAAEKQAQQTVTAVQDRIRQTDWKTEARQGTVRGLRWLSRRLADLANRFTPSDAPPPDDKPAQ